jgi:putative restriction endonuclease
VPRHRDDTDRVRDSAEPDYRLSEPEAILAAVDRLSVWKRGDERAPHKPLLLLLSLARIQRGEDRLVRFADIETDLKKLLRRFGPPRRSVHPEYPFWWLRTNGLWEIPGASELSPRKGNSNPPADELRQKQACGGLPEGLDARLRADPELLATVARRLLDQHFPSSIHEDILADVGLDIEDAELAIDALRRRPRRDPLFQAAVLQAYEHRCAVCGYDGRLTDRPVGLEAAHVKWFSHAGPSAVENGLCLCSLHHKALDLGAIGLSEDRTLLVSQAFLGGARWKELFLVFAGEKVLGPQAGQPAVAIEFQRWHLKEVFRGPWRRWS